MLNKHVCMQCIGSTSDDKIWSGWNALDDADWKENGVVDCPVYGLIKISQQKPDPDHCRYALEHIVS